MAALGGFPKISTVPAPGCSNPAAISSRVDLPAPLGPTRAQTAPAGMLKVQPPSASGPLRRYLLVTPRAVSAGSALLVGNKAGILRWMEIVEYGGEQRGEVVAFQSGRVGTCGHLGEFGPPG